MSIFVDATLPWEGKEYTVPASKIMGLIDVIEESVTLEDLSRGGGIKRGKMSKAYRDALVYAGAQGVTQEDVYSAFYNLDDPNQVQMIITNILTLMIPPAHLVEETDPKPQPATKRKPRAASGKRTK